MSGFRVNILLDIDRFEAALDNWRDALVTETASATLEAAEFIKELVQENMALFPHPKSVPTEAPPFKGPVGLISGHLRDTVEVRPLLFGSATVGVYGVYARIQELGGWTGGSRTLYHSIKYINGIPMVSGPYASGSHFTYLPPRPYFRSMVEEVDTSGPSGLEHIYYDHWLEAQRRALAF